MKQTTITCDNCSKQELMSSDIEAPLPIGWFELTQIDMYDSGEVVLEACSLACVAEWATKQQEAKR